MPIYQAGGAISADCRCSPSPTAHSGQDAPAAAALAQPVGEVGGRGGGGGGGGEQAANSTAAAAVRCLPLPSLWQAGQQADRQTDRQTVRKQHKSASLPSLDSVAHRPGLASGEEGK